MVALRPALVGEHDKVGPTLGAVLTPVTLELPVLISTVKVMVVPAPENVLGEAAWLVICCASAGDANAINA